MATGSRLIRRVGICGVGQMGAAAAVCYKRAGYHVTVWDEDPQVLHSASDTFADLESWLLEHAGPPSAHGGVCETAGGLQDLGAQADLIMDCITEDMAEKVRLFRALRPTAREDVLYITTTSGLSITGLGEASGIEPSLVGTHFWNPPHLMPLVEVIRGRHTTDGAVDRVVEVIESIGKIPVRVNRDVPGFIGNRLLHAMWREAIHLVQEGVASAEDIDRVARLTFGLRAPAVGPLENMDLVGLDLIKAIHEYLLRDLSNDTEPLPALERHLADGNLGMKTGHGFYDWQMRDGRRLLERRNRQIVHQLAFLRESDLL